MSDYYLKYNDQIRPHWDLRDKVTTQEDAMEALSDYLSSSGGIVDARNDNLDEAEQFAHKWDIPFNRKMTMKLMTSLNSKRWNGDLIDPYRVKEMAEEKGLDPANLSPEDRNMIIEELRENDDDYYSSFRHVWQSSSEQC